MGDKKLSLKILTPESTLFEGAVEKVIVPASDGELGVLPQHAPLVTMLGLGELRATVNGNVDRYALFEGFMRVSGDLVSVLAEAAEPLEKIDRQNAESELARIKDIPPGKRTEEDLAAMARCRIRLKVAARA
jgi:F-type H+-transporting ATPase subunit epsilon